MKKLILLFTIALFSCESNIKPVRVVVVEKAYTPGGMQYGYGYRLRGGYGYGYTFQPVSYTLFYDYNGKTYEKNVTKDQYVHTHIGDTITIYKR